MRALVVVPSYYVNGRLLRRRSVPVIGLAGPYLAALLRPIGTIDLVLETVDPRDWQTVRADVAFISATHVTAYRALEISAILRSRGIKTVCGGYFPSVPQTRDAAQAGFDSIVVGEAEPVLDELLRDAQAGTLKPTYVSSNQADVRNLPCPDFSGIPKAALHSEVFLPVRATRGCTNGCHFCCMNMVYGRRFLKRPIAQVVAEISRYPGRNWFFCDDNIVLDPAYATDLFRALKGRMRRFIIQVGVAVADHPDLLKAMCEAGKPEIYIGFETLMSTGEVGKVRTEREYEDAVRRILAAGDILIDAGFMLGMDGDDKTAFDRVLAFMKRTGCHFLHPWILNVVGGSVEIGQEFEFGTRASRDTPLLSRTELDEGYWAMLRQYYSLKTLVRLLRQPGMSWSQRGFIAMRMLLHSARVRKHLHPMSE